MDRTDYELEPVTAEPDEHTSMLDALVEAAASLRPSNPSWAMSLLGLVLCPDRDEREAPPDDASDAFAFDVFAAPDAFDLG